MSETGEVEWAGRTHRTSSWTITKMPGDGNKVCFGHVILPFFFIVEFEVLRATCELHGLVIGVLKPAFIP